MSNKVLALYPVNRHLTIVPHISKNETNTGVLLPDDFELEEDRYIAATLISVAADCSQPFQRINNNSFGEKVIIVDRKMIEEINLKEGKFHIILENYVLGHLRTPGNED